MDKHPITSSILAQVSAKHDAIVLNLPDTVDEKWAAVEQAEITLALNIAELGYRYMDLKETLGHGEFMNALADRGIAPRTVQRYIGVAEFFYQAGESNAPTLAHLKPSQIDVLARLPEQKKKELTPEKIEDYGKMSVRALEQEVKQLRLELDEQNKVEAENVRLKREKRELEESNAALINELNNEQLRKAPETRFGLHAKVQHTRQQAVVLNECMSELVSNLTHEVEECTNSALDPKLALECATTLWYNISAPIMQLNHCLNKLKHAYGADVLSDAEHMPIYSKEELEDALSMANLVRNPLLGGM